MTIPSPEFGAWHPGLVAGWRYALNIAPAAAPFLVRHLPFIHPDASWATGVTIQYRPDWRSAWRPADVRVATATAARDQRAPVWRPALPASSDSPAIFLGCTAMPLATPVFDAARAMVLSTAAESWNAAADNENALWCIGPAAAAGIMAEPGLAWARTVITDSHDVMRTLGECCHPALKFCAPRTPATSLEDPPDRYQTRIHSHFFRAVAHGAFCFDVAAASATPPALLEIVAGWFGDVFGYGSTFLSTRGPGNGVQVRLSSPVLESEMIWAITPGAGAGPPVVCDPNGDRHAGRPQHLSSVSALLAWLFATPDRT